MMMMMMMIPLSVVILSCIFIYLLFAVSLFLVVASTPNIYRLHSVDQSSLGAVLASMAVHCQCPGGKNRRMRPWGEFPKTNNE